MVGGKRVERQVLLTLFIAISGDWRDEEAARSNAMWNETNRYREDAKRETTGTHDRNEAASSAFAYPRSVSASGSEW